MNVELIIENNGKLYSPPVYEGFSWQTERVGSAGKLTFSILESVEVAFSEGNAVRLKVDDFGVFYGFIFTQKRSKDGKIDITAYDQLRYLKNKDTYVYTNKTATDVIKMIAEDFQLNLGEIAQTSYIIPSRVEDNTSLFDIILNALDLEVMNKKQMFVLFDDFGKLTLKNISQMYLPVIIDCETAENYNYTESIDEQTYNKIKLSFENEKSGKRDIYIEKSGENINKWGVLQYYDTLQEGENGAVKSGALLDLYNTPTRSLKITNVLGDNRVRAGSMVIVNLKIGELSIKKYLLVETCTHKYNQNEHFMDVTVRGGQFE